MKPFPPTLMLLALAVPLAPAAFVPAAAQVRQPSDKAGLTQVADYIRAVRSLTADFTQTDRNGHILTGKLTLKQPGKIRFQYQADVPMLIVGDGRALTMIDYEVRQVQRWPIGSSPLGALIDPSRDFTFAADGRTWHQLVWGAQPAPA